VYLEPVRVEFGLRMDSADDLVASIPTDEGKETSQDQDLKGFVFVTLYGAYERLLKQVFRIHLETISAELTSPLSDVSPSLRALGLKGTLQSVRDRNATGLWWDDCSRDLDTALAGSCASLDLNFFPDDGSFFRKSQVRAVWRFMGIAGDPAAALGPAWEELETIRLNRNKIAHGELSPRAVGSRYTHAQLEKIAHQWRAGWSMFVDTSEEELRVLTETDNTV